MDKQIFDYMDAECRRQNEGIELIASENYVSQDVRKACGSILTNKYAEGYPQNRYYGGCQFIDEIENLAIERACQLFGAKYANVQPHSGSQANAAAYRALLPHGGKILSLVLNDGGHLTHGSPVSFSSHLYTFVHYPLNREGKLDYALLLKIAKQEQPQVILAGYSSYPYAIDFQKIKEICDQVGCAFMVDMAHIAGLIAAGYHQNPVPYADIVTSTTHKTLRGPRGGLILTNREDLIKKINSAVFPYYQGGPLEHIIAGKAICFLEAQQPHFKEYVRNLMHNTRVCAETLQQLGASVSGTDNHLFLLNTLKSYHKNGKLCQELLQSIHITTNKNMLPNDTLTPKETSGLRIGFAAVTTRGCTEEDAKTIAELIHGFLSGTLSKKDALAIVHAMTHRWKKIEDLIF